MYFFPVLFALFVIVVFLFVVILCAYTVSLTSFSKISAFILLNNIFNFLGKGAKVVCLMNSHV